MKQKYDMYIRAWLEHQYAVSSNIFTWNANCFKSNFLGLLSLSVGQKQLPTTVYNKKSNSRVDRYNIANKRSLRIISSTGDL